MELKDQVTLHLPGRRIVFTKAEDGSRLTVDYGNFSHTIRHPSRYWRTCMYEALAKYIASELLN